MRFQILSIFASTSLFLLGPINCTRKKNARKVRRYSDDDISFITYNEKKIFAEFLGLMIKCLRFNLCRNTESDSDKEFFEDLIDQVILLPCFMKVEQRINPFLCFDEETQIMIMNILKNLQLENDFLYYDKDSEESKLEALKDTDEITLNEMLIEFYLNEFISYCEEDYGKKSTKCLSTKKMITSIIENEEITVENLLNHFLKNNILDEFGIFNEHFRKNFLEKVDLKIIEGKYTSRFAYSVENNKCLDYFTTLIRKFLNEIKEAVDLIITKNARDTKIRKQQMRTRSEQNSDDSYSPAYGEKSDNEADNGINLRSKQKNKKILNKKNKRVNKPKPVKDDVIEKNSDITEQSGSSDTKKAQFYIDTSNSDKEDINSLESLSNKNLDELEDKKQDS